MPLFEWLALGLDTLPSSGRIMLLAFLLTLAFYFFARVLPADLQSPLHLLYRKGALVALLCVPLTIYLLGFQVPVLVDEVVRLELQWPAQLSFVLAVLWTAGMTFFGYQLVRGLRATIAKTQSNQPASAPIVGRLKHWQNRLNFTQEVEVRCGGSDLAWHIGALPGVCKARIVLPAAALNWPAGIVDVALLSQLTQLKQRCWVWLVWARAIGVVYWLMPWVAQLEVGLVQHLQRPAWRLAAAAYRDKEGWARDARNLRKRADTLTAVPYSAGRGLLQLPNDGAAWIPQPQKTHFIAVDGVSFEEKWAGTKRRKRDKARDPYEQAYWLIALASILVGVASTLTLVERSPDFEPQFLNVKWQDQMVRRIQDDGPAPSSPTSSPAESSD